jgi:serine/threonine protein kinase
MTAGGTGSELPSLRPDDPSDIAGYQLLRRIGEGGMGSVYLSRTRGGQPVALKVIRGEFAQDEEFRRRFQQEVQAARQVQGYHVVPVVDHDTTGTMSWLACRYVPGLALDKVLTRHGALPLPVVLQLVGCIAQALRAVHAAGVIHRDLKPSNVLLGADGPWVIDFGIARAADATQLTVSGGLIGTPQFMSPEHALGDTLTPATDVFALGLIAAVAATGRHPYGDSGAITLATRIANTELRPPDLSGYPAELQPLLRRCLVADPAARATPAELAELCDQAAGRSLRDFEGWLPAALAAEIVSSETAVQQALATVPAVGPSHPPTVPAVVPSHPPTVPAVVPSHPPTVPAVAPSHPPTVPATAPNHPAYAPTQTAAPGAPGTPGGWSPTAAAPGPAPLVPPVPFAAPAANRRRAPVLVAAAVGVVLVGAVGYAMADRGSHPDAAAGGHQGPGSTAPRTPGAPGSQNGAAAQQTSAAPAAPKVRFGPGDVTISSNDLDFLDLDASTPMAVPNRADIMVIFTSGAPSITDYDGRMALAKYPASGPAPTAAQCAETINRIGTYTSGDVSVGDRFCYKTSQNRIAYLVASAVPTGIGPLRLTVTVWEQSG